MATKAPAGTPPSGPRPVRKSLNPAALLQGMLQAQINPPGKPGPKITPGVPPTPPIPGIVPQAPADVVGALSNLLAGGTPRPQTPPAPKLEPAPKSAGRPAMDERIPFITRGFVQRKGILYNPDDLIGRKGLQIYDRMGQDDQVAAALKVKKLSRMASGWDIEAASDSPEDLAVRDFVVHALSRIPGSLDAKLIQMLSCLQYGFSLAEKLWKIEDEGRWKGKIVYRDIKPKSPFGLQFVVDDYGNILDDGIELNLGFIDGKTNRVRRDKVALWSYNTEFCNPYGYSDLRPAYRSWFSKDFILKYFNLHIERYASPTLMAYLPDNLSPDEVRRIQAVLETYQNQAAITLPDNVNVKFEESRLGGAIAFKFADAIDMHNKFISRAILVPDLMGYSGSTAGGSFALGKKQVDVFFMILKALGTDIEETLMGEQVIRPLVDFNFGNVRRYPRFRFREIESDLPTKVKVLTLLIQAGAVNPREDWVRGYLELPQQSLAPHAAEMFAAQTELFQARGHRMGSSLCRACSTLVGHEFVADHDAGGIYHHDCWTGHGNHASEVVIRDGVARTFAIGTRAAVLLEMQQAETEGGAALAQQPEADEFAEAAPRPPTPLERATPVREMKDTLGKLVEDAGQRAAQVFRVMRDKLLGQVRKRQIVAQQDFEALERVTVNVGDFAKLLLGLELTAAGNGEVWAVRELERKLPKPQADMADRALSTSTRSLSPVEARAHFNGQRAQPGGVLIKIDLGGMLDDFFRNRSFLLAGAEKEWITSQARQILTTFIKQGDPRAAEEHIVALFDAYIPRGDQSRPARLYSLLNTTVGEALNEGRRAVFESEALQDKVVAYQWCSVLDARTTEYCREMDTKVFRKEQIATLFPPAHYQCRSFLVAVVEGESFEFAPVDPTSPATGVMRQRGFAEQHDHPHVD